MHEENRKMYGCPRVCKILNAQSVNVCRNTVATTMKERQIRSKSKKKFFPRTTDSRHEQPIAGKVLGRQFQAERPNQKWAVDLTYIPTRARLALSGRDDRPVLEEDRRLVDGWNPGDGLLHHSDRGVQYASEDYQHLLKSHGMQISMSGIGDCWDNAPAESFWAALKTELVNHQHYATHEQVRASIFEYIEVFYNRKRIHSLLGYLSPETFEAA